MKLNYRKAILPALIVTGVTALSVSGLGLVSAATPSSQQDNLVDKIATKFHLKKADVQAVFDEDHAAREAQHEKDQQTRLDQAVKDGKITSEQKAKIIAKQKEMKAEREANKDEFKNLGQDERHAKMEAKRTELEQWAKDNNIPIEYLMPMGHGGPGGPGDGHGDMQ